MKKEQFIEILNYGIINPRDKEQLRDVLELNEEQVNILLNSNVSKDITLSLLMCFKDTNKVKYVLECMSGVNNKEILNQILRIAYDNHLQQSEHWASAIKFACQIKDEKLIRTCMDFITNFRMLSLKPEQYNAALSLAINITNLEQMKNYITATKACIGTFGPFIEEYNSVLEHLKPQNIERVANIIIKAKTSPRFVNLKDVLRTIDYILKLQSESNLDTELLNEFMGYIDDEMNGRIEDKEIDNGDLNIMSYVKERINDSNLITLISQNPNDVFKILNQLDPNIDLNSNTFVKTLNINNEK